MQCFVALLYKTIRCLRRKTYIDVKPKARQVTTKAVVDEIESETNKPQIYTRLDKLVLNDVTFSKKTHRDISAKGEQGHECVQAWVVNLSTVYHGFRHGPIWNNGLVFERSLNESEV